MPVTTESCLSSLRWAGQLFGRSAGQSSTRVPGTLLTSVWPSRSRIGPRGASIISVRTRLSFACERYLLTARTWSAQRRRKSTAKIASATAPRTPTRSASCGVRRYGSSTRGSGGRNRRGGELAKQPYLVDAVGQLVRWEEPAHERVDRQREDQVQQQVRRQGREEHARRGRVAEHEAQRERAERIQDRDDTDGEDRRMETVACGRLAVTADPVARERQEQRREAERAERGGVDQQ